MLRGLITIHMHNPQILHRDLKSLNLLVSEDWICKLCDFGLARFDTGGNMDTLTKLRGTFAYSAPEVYFGERYTAKSDMFSIGILLWELAYRVINQKYQRPYEEFPKLKLDWQIILKTATENLRPTMPTSTPLPLAILIRQMVVKDQAGRPDAKEVLQQILEMRDHYERHRNEWDSAIVAERTG
jgi:serine/threonine protein kinase